MQGMGPIDGDTFMDKINPVPFPYENWWNSLLCIFTFTQ